MTRKPPTDTERITGLRESIEAANGDWHQVTALWSVQADLDWLLSRAERADLDAALAAPVAGLDVERLAIDAAARMEGEVSRLRTELAACTEAYNAALEPSCICPAVVRLNHEPHRVGCPFAVPSEQS